jgi:hypothetical protein
MMSPSDFSRLEGLELHLRIRFLARLAHMVTIIVRECYSCEGEGFCDAPMARRLNEMEHRITGLLTDAVMGSEGQHDIRDVLEAMLMVEDQGIKRKLEFAIHWALKPGSGEPTGGP